MSFVWVGLTGFAIIVVFIIWVAIQTGVLAASIFILSGENDNPFKEEPQLVVWGKCAGLVTAVALMGFIPGFGWVLSLIAWFLGIMMLFERTFGQAIMIFLANIAIGFLVNWLLALILT